MRPSPARTARDTLVQLARVIDHGLAARGWEEQPTVLVHTTAPDAAGAFDLGLKEVDEHPAIAFLGTAAPDGWEAVGASQLGWASPWPGADDGRGHAEDGRARQRVRVTTLMSRTVGEVTVVRHEGVDEAEELPPPAIGRVPDVLRRCLHLPTPPPEEPVAAFFVAVWLGAIRRAGEVSDRAMSWSRIRALHPAAMTGRPLVVSAGQQAARTDWGELRWQTVEGRWPLPWVDPELAAWFDDGSFARWVQQSNDLQRVAPYVTDDAWRRLRAAARALRT